LLGSGSQQWIFLWFNAFVRLAAVSQLSPERLFWLHYSSFQPSWHSVYRILFLGICYITRFSGKSRKNTSRKRNGWKQCWKRPCPHLSPSYNIAHSCWGYSKFAEHLDQSGNVFGLYVFRRLRIDIPFFVPRQSLRFLTGVLSKCRNRTSHSVTTIPFYTTSNLVFNTRSNRLRPASVATDPEVPGSITRANRFSEKYWVWNGVHLASCG
jgi:hypothetical protein